MEEEWKAKVKLWMKEYQIEKVNFKLIMEALTHSSYKGMGNDVKDNERLEFLGDAVLDLISAHQLFLNSKLSEGVMTEERKKMVSNEILAPLFDKTRLKALAKTANDFNFPIKVKADFIEALFGAVFIDKGYMRCVEFWETIQISNNEYLFETSVNIPIIINHQKKETVIKPVINAKNALQEYCQKLYLPLPKYSVINKEGLEHEPLYTVEVQVTVLIRDTNEILKEFASASNIKRAEILSAEKICNIIKLDYTTV